MKEVKKVREMEKQEALEENFSSIGYLKLRDQIALSALQGIIIKNTDYTIQWCSKRAYEYADAMLEAR